MNLLGHWEEEFVSRIIFFHLLVKPWIEVHHTLVYNCKKSFIAKSSIWYSIMFVDIWIYMSCLSFPMDFKILLFLLYNQMFLMLVKVIIRKILRDFQKYP